MLHTIFALSFTILLTGPSPAVHVTSMAELRTALRAPKPGTVITLAPGNYNGGLFCNTLQGEEGRPIIIRSADRSRHAVFTSQVHLINARHVRLEDFTIQGSKTNGLNVDDGGDFNTPAEKIVLRGLNVLDTGPKGNLDGIKLSGLQDFLIDGCTVQSWGAGGSAIDMVGCHRGLIRGCIIDGSKRPATTGIQCKGASSRIVIGRCQFKNAGSRAVNIGGATGEPFFRPKGANYESRQILVIGNDFTGSTAAVAFATSTESEVLFNRINNPDKWVLRILQEKPVPPYIACSRNIFAHNQVTFQAARVRHHVNVGPNTRPDTFRFQGNWWYAEDAPEKSRPVLPARETGGVYGKKPDPKRVASAARKAWRGQLKKRVPWAAAQQ